MIQKHRNLMSFQRIASQPIPIPTLGQFIDQPNLMNQLTKIGTSSHPMWGVHVYWSPSGTGKSTYLKKACASIQQSTLADVIYIENLSPVTSFNGDFDGLLKSRCGLDDNIRCLDDVLQNHERKVIIAIDHFDSLMCRPEITDWITYLAEESVDGKKFIIIVAVSDPLIATNISCLNGGQKFAPIQGQIWSTQQIQDYIASLLPKDDSSWCDQEKQHLVELGLIAKNPRFINGLIGLQNPKRIFDVNLHQLAQTHKDLWEIGSTMIDSRHKYFKC